MRLDPYPIFRKRIDPWFDTDAVCIAALVLLFLVFLFSLSGIFVALETPVFRAHAWFPVMLAGLCICAIVSISLRLFRRRFPVLTRRKR